MTKLLLMLLSFCSLNAYADFLDDELDTYIRRFQFKAVTKPTNKNLPLYKLGQKLFSETEVSGNRNVSCSSCHATHNFSTDLLPLSIGVGGSHQGANSSTHGVAPIIARNSPHLFNLGDESQTMMFWDGRVSYAKREHIFSTPELGLNGALPEFKNITKVLSGALAAQTLFPPLNSSEMKGYNNDIADAKTNYEAWSQIMKRLLSINEYKELFESAYPKDQTFNIGHFGSALAHFIKYKYEVSDTPWDEYLRGDKKAMSMKEKKGAIVFVKRGLCANCHSGEMLGGDTFHNVMAPQIGPGTSENNDDLGLFNLTKNPRHKYKFKTPTLRNTALTAPYFHSGAIKTLEDVVDHYAKGVNAADSYDSSWLKAFEDTTYLETLFVEKDPRVLSEKKRTAHPILQRNFVTFNVQEREELLLFLKKSLTSKTFLTRD